MGKRKICIVRKGRRLSMKITYWDLQVGERIENTGKTKNVFCDKFKILKEDLHLLTDCRDVT